MVLFAVNTFNQLEYNPHIHTDEFLPLEKSNEADIDGV